MNDRISKEMAQMPDDFDVIADTSAHSGNWVMIETWNSSVSFPDDTTGIVVNGSGKNLSGLNSDMDAGKRIYGDYTKITLTAGIVIAYRR